MERDEFNRKMAEWQESDRVASQAEEQARRIFNRPYDPLAIAALRRARELRKQSDQLLSALAKAVRGPT